MFSKQEWADCIRANGFFIPAFLGEYEDDGGTATRDTVQKGMLVKGVEVSIVEKEGSVIDLVVKKGDSELLVGLWGHDTVLTHDQCKTIYDSGRSYIAIINPLASDIVKSATTGFQSLDLDNEFKAVFPMATWSQQTSFWINHKKYGFKYDSEKKEIRI